MRFWMIGAVALLALSGCAAQQEAHDDATCQSYGAPPGSRAYYDCRQHLADQRQQMISQYLQMRAATPTPVYQPAPMPYLQPPRAPTNCITNYVGGSAYTSCQ